jgi:hypothetical protein
MPCDSDFPVATKVAAGVPEAEIEVTPEMVRAGANVLCRNSMVSETLSFSFACFLVEEILSAALSKKIQVGTI